MKIRIGTRASQLALAQANEVGNLLAPYANIEIVPIITTGDKILDKNLAEIGGKGLFTKEIEDSLINGSIDIAVHSMKDMPANKEKEFCLTALLPREDPRDAFISSKYQTLDKLPSNSIIGTSSIRRQSQILNLRPDLKIVPFRGNINTRLAKLANDEVDAIILAVAGLKRIQADVNYSILEVNQMLPAVAQGAIVVECLTNNYQMRELLVKINHYPTEICVRTERAFLSKLEGNCKTPIAALAILNNIEIQLTALIATEDGKIIHKITDYGTLSSPEELGLRAAEQLLLQKEKDKDL